jgi:hypothetical protein
MWSEVGQRARNGNLYVPVGHLVIAMVVSEHTEPLTYVVL